MFTWLAPYWFDANARLPGLEVGYQYQVKPDREVGYNVDVEILCYRYNWREIDQRTVEEYSDNREIVPMLAEEIRQALENEASRWFCS